LSLHLGAVGILDGDGTDMMAEGQLVVAPVADAESVGFAVEAVLLGL
jgi:hypothetical protein